MKLPPGVRQVGPDHWEIRAQVRNTRTGLVLRPKRRVHGTLKEAVAERKAMITEAREKGGRTDTETMTLGVYADTWIERAKARGQRANTLRVHVQSLVDHILPRFGDWYVVGIRRRDVEAWLVDCTRLVSARTKKAYSPVTLNSWLDTLKSCVAAFCADHELGASPLGAVASLPVPDRQDDDPNSLDEQQLAQVLTRLRELYPQHWAMAFLGFTTGLRWSELSALEWQDVDEAAGLLRIRRGQVLGKVGPPKTPKSRRNIALVAEQIQVLRDHRRQQVERQSPGLDRGLIFPSATGAHCYWHHLGRPMQRVAKDLGIAFRISTKAMRRSFNNLLRRQGVDRQVLRSLTGHTSEKMTGVYSTVAATEKAEAVGIVVRMAGAKVAQKWPNGPSRDPNSE